MEQAMITMAREIVSTLDVLERKTQQSATALRGNHLGFPLASMIYRGMVTEISGDGVIALSEALTAVRDAEALLP